MSNKSPSVSPSESNLDLSQDETAPLLTAEARTCSESTYGASAGDDGADTRSETEPTVQAPTPLPVKQILLLSLMRMSSPIAYSQIFPYINEMMVDIGVADDPTQVGYYSGIVDSIYSFIQLFTCLRIGMLADQIGRKPVLLMGLFGIVASTFFFGLSKSFIFAVTTRAVAGALSGNAMVINSAVGDITDETNQVQAYVWTGLAYNIAAILGPVIGGTFAKPEVTFPNTFGSLTIFRHFPYLLPCSMTSMVGLISFVLCAFFFKETASRRPVLKKEASYYSSQDINEDAISAENISAWQLALDPVLFSVLRAFFILNFLNTSSMVVFTLFAYTPIEHGGLSRSPEEIGFAVAFSGFLAGTLEVIFLAPLQRRFGSITLYRWTMALWPAIFLLFPITHYVARLTMDITDSSHAHAGSTQPASLAVWVAISVLLTLNRVATMAYPINIILTRNATPSEDVIGTVFGLSQLTGCIARTIGPTFSSSLFAFSIEHDVLGGKLIWLVMTATSALGLWATMSVQDGRSDGQDEIETSEQE